VRVMILAKSSPKAESVEGKPDADAMAAMGRFTAELTNAGVLLDAGRLYPSAKGARVRFRGSSRKVIDGPFIEAKELVGGYWMWQVSSLDEAIDWLKRAPFDGGEFEIRQVDETAVIDESAPLGTH
jgi:hypothetical protein